MIGQLQADVQPKPAENTYVRFFRPAGRIRARWRRHSVAVIIVGLGTFVVALAGIVVVIQQIFIPGGSADVWKEVSKGIIQLALVAVLGGAVGLTYRLIDQDRDRRHAMHAQRIVVFEQLLAAYHELRSVRRAMKFAGLHLLPAADASGDHDTPSSTSEGVLRSERVEVLNAGMLRVANVQLTLNKVSRSLGIQDLFDDYHAVSKPLGELTNSVEKLVQEWQTHGIDFWPEARVADISSLPRLKGFLADKSVSFGEQIVRPFGQIYRAVGRELYGGMHEASENAANTS